MASKIVTFFSCKGPICGGALPAPVILCVPWEKVAPHICPENAGNQPFQFSYIEGELVGECENSCGQWMFDVSYDIAQLNPGYELLGGDIIGAECKNCIGHYADQRAGNEVHVIEDEEGGQFLVSQHGCQYPLTASGAGTVLRVFGRVGHVLAQFGDYTWNLIDKTVSDIADITNRSHTDLTDIGVNTHPQIDSHIANMANPHNVTKAQVGLGNVTNDAQLKRAAGDFNTFPLKNPPAGADIVLIEDSAAAFAKKKTTLSNIISAVSPVLSVFGRVGNVVAQNNDYTWAQINKTISNIADITTKSHTSLTDIGVNTHPQIDAHIADLANPHATTAAQVGLGNVTNDAQLKRDANDFTTFANKAAVVGADVLLIEDSAALGVKKNILISAIQTFIDALTRAAGDFSTFAVKAVPVLADVLLIEDSAALGVKKSITLTNLPRAYSEQSATLNAATSSAAYVVIPGMTVTPAAGTYKATFSSSADHSNNGILANYAIHVNAAVVAHSERDFITAGGANNAVHTQAIVTVTGVEAVDVRYKTAANTFTMHERSLILEKLKA